MTSQNVYIFFNLYFAFLYLLYMSFCFSGRKKFFFCLTITQFIDLFVQNFIVSTVYLLSILLIQLNFVCLAHKFSWFITPGCTVIFLVHFFIATKSKILAGDARMLAIRSDFLRFYQIKILTDMGIQRIWSFPGRCHRSGSMPWAQTKKPSLNSQSLGIQCLGAKWDTRWCQYETGNWNNEDTEASSSSFAKTQKLDQL